MPPHRIASEPFPNPRQIAVGGPPLSVEFDRGEQTGIRRAAAPDPNHGPPPTAWQ
jgi:hypothetical protein